MLLNLLQSVLQWVEVIAKCNYGSKRYTLFYTRNYFKSSRIGSLYEK